MAEVQRHGYAPLEDPHRASLVRVLAGAVEEGQGVAGRAVCPQAE